jgi:hypothetical protein
MVAGCRSGGRSAEPHADRFVLTGDSAALQDEPTHVVPGLLLKPRRERLEAIAVSGSAT